MRYKDINCEKCGVPFAEEDDVVVCPICGAPHHRTCWLETNVCAHAVEHENGYQWEMPEQKKAESEKKQSKPLHNEFILKNGESVIVCPRCGAMNCENDVYCMRCSFPLKEETNTPPDPSQPFNNMQGAFQQPDQAYIQRDRMFSDFNRFGGIDPAAELDGIPVAEYSDYVGGKTPGKIIRKVAVMDRFGKSVTCCWPALFIGPVWFFWRKMIKEGLLLSLALIALCTAAGFLQINEPLIKYYKESFASFQQVMNGELTMSEFQKKLADQANILQYAELTPEESKKEKLALVCMYLAEPGIPIVCAASAIYFYRKKVKASVMDIRERCSSMEEYRETLRREGGTSIGWGIIGALLFVGAHLCINYLPVLTVILK